VAEVAPGAGRRLAEVGPFLSFSVGKYGSASAGGTSADIPMTAFHEWLQIGVRGTFNL